jgi:hypothetical protein
VARQCGLLGASGCSVSGRQGSDATASAGARVS